MTSDMYQKLTTLYSYVKIAPTEIQVGNIVEAQVAFCAVPISKGRFKMLLKLRSVCILDRTVARVRYMLLLVANINSIH